MARKKCDICAAECSSLRKSPTTCSRDHSAHERACDECWESHLSFQVEELDPRDIECIFCKSKINRVELERLARKATLIRYDSKLEDATRRKCQVRCAASVDHDLQNHDREKDGRVFACQFCNFQTCVDCDRPEHDGETCEEYRTRVVFAPQHIQAENATKAAYKMCPGCDSIFKMEKGCGYTQCNACSYRFCSRCMIAWVGESSAYLGGKEAHAEGCPYRKRDADSKHALKRRFRPDDETMQRLAEHEEVKGRKREVKRQKLGAKKQAETEGDGGSV